MMVCWLEIDEALSALDPGGLRRPVGARGTVLQAVVGLCLHDTLLVHVPTEHCEAVAVLRRDCLSETSQRWAPHTARPGIRLVANISVITDWCDTGPLETVGCVGSQFEKGWHAIAQGRGE